MKGRRQEEKEVARVEKEGTEPRGEEQWKRKRKVASVCVCEREREIDKG